MTERKCYSCGVAWDASRDNLRPYGPDGKDVCHGCAFATPEDRKRTEGAFKARMDAVDGPVVLTQRGPKSVGEARADESLATIIPRRRS